MPRDVLAEQPSRDKSFEGSNDLERNLGLWKWSGKRTGDWRTVDLDSDRSIMKKRHRQGFRLHGRRVPSSKNFF